MTLPKMPEEILRIQQILEALRTEALQAAAGTPSSGPGSVSRRAYHEGRAEAFQSALGYLKRVEWQPE